MQCCLQSGCTPCICSSCEALGEAVRTSAADTTDAVATSGERETCSRHHPALDNINK